MPNSKLAPGLTPILKNSNSDHGHYSMSNLKRSHNQTSQSTRLDIQDTLNELKSKDICTIVMMRFKDQWHLNSLSIWYLIVGQPMNLQSFVSIHTFVLSILYSQHMRTTAKLMGT